MFRALAATRTDRSTDWIGSHGLSGEVVTFTLQAHRNMTIGDKADS